MHKHTHMHAHVHTYTHLVIISRQKNQLNVTELNFKKHVVKNKKATKYKNSLNMVRIILEMNKL